MDLLPGANAWQHVHPAWSGSNRQRSLQLLLWAPLLEHGCFAPEGLRRLGERVDQVPHGCHQRIQPHQPRQPGRKYSIGWHDHRRGAWTRTSSVGVLSLSQVLIEQEEPQQTLGGASAPLFLFTNKLVILSTSTRTIELRLK